jgi:predicted amidophosphoribosyltransferase
MNPTESPATKHRRMLRRSAHKKGLCSRCQQPNDRLPKKICGGCAEFDRQSFQRRQERNKRAITIANELRKENTQVKKVNQVQARLISKAVQVLTGKKESK